MEPALGVDPLATNAKHVGVFTKRHELRLAAQAFNVTGGRELVDVNNFDCALDRGGRLAGTVLAGERAVSGEVNRRRRTESCTPAFGRLVLASLLGYQNML